MGSGLNTGRLADHLSASLLARVVPAEVVHEALDAHGCNSQRLCSFPAVVGVYYCMALSLYPEAFYRGLRLMAMDGSNFELADEADNVTQFGRPGSRTGVAS